MELVEARVAPWTRNFKKYHDIYEITMNQLENNNGRRKRAVEDQFAENAPAAGSSKNLHSKDLVLSAIRKHQYDEHQPKHASQFWDILKYFVF